MQAYLAYVKSSRPTGKFLARQLGINCGIAAPDESLDVLVRWGSRRQMPSSTIELNNPTAVYNASDKLMAHSMLQNAGLSTVWMTTDFDNAVQNSDGIVLGRNRMGCGGRDIVVYHSGEHPIQQHDFYTPYLHTKREVRIHVVRDKVVRVQGKYLDFPERAGEGLIKNYAHGYRFRSPKQELHRRRREEAIRAIQALGLDFGAVDMLVNSDRDHYILEVNTAPACSPLTARCYAGEIALQIERQTSGEIRLASEILTAELSYNETEWE